MLQRGGRRLKPKGAGSELNGLRQFAQQKRSGRTRHVAAIQTQGIIHRAGTSCSLCVLAALSLQSNLEQHGRNVCRRPKRCDAVNKYGNISSDDTHLPGQRCLSCTQATLVTAEHPIALSSGSSGALVARSVCPESTATSIGGSNSLRTHCHGLL